MKKDVIFLVGFMGCGKSAVGKVLAGKLGYAYYDTDEMVEKKEGSSIEEIFKDSGEGYFREKEWEALNSLNGIRDAVVSTGGGLFLGSNHRQFIKELGISVWLDSPFEDILKRLTSGPVRPLFRNEAELRQMLENRKGRYALADYHIATRGLTIEEIIERVIRLLRPQ